MRHEEDRAGALLRKYGISKPPVPVEEIATAEGAVVVRNRFDGTESGFTLRDGRRVIIGINTRTSKKRQRFSIAHELGHVILHPLSPLIVDHAVRIDWRDDVSALGTDAQEIEANAFSAALLMPKEMVIEEIKRYVSRSRHSDAEFQRGEFISELARKFDVSTEAIGFRLINLGVFAA